MRGKGIAKPTRAPNPTSAVRVPLHHMTRKRSADAQSASATSATPPTKRKKRPSTADNAPVLSGAPVDTLSTPAAVDNTNSFTSSLASDVASLKEAVATLTTMVRSQATTSTSTVGFGAGQPVPPVGDVHPTPPSSTTIGEFQNIPITMGTPIHRPMHAAGVPIGTNIKDLVKAKIWELKYLELRDLLYPNQTPSYLLQLADNDSNSPQLNLSPRKRKSLSETEWGAAMDIFVSIYVQKYPAQLNDILSYCQHVKDLMRNAANWRQYDYQYRLDREFSHCSWLLVRQDLELRAFRSPTPTQTNTSKNNNFSSSRQGFSPTSSSSNKPPSGYCFAYHQKGARCETDNCPYKHTCPKCQQKHPMFYPCNSRKSDKPSYPKRTPDKNTPKSG
jgi:hypothetical protein